MKKILCVTAFCMSFLAFSAERSSSYKRLGELDSNPRNRKNSSRRKSSDGTILKPDKNKNPKSIKEPEPDKYGDNRRKSGSLK